MLTVLFQTWFKGKVSSDLRTQSYVYAYAYMYVLRYVSAYIYTYMSTMVCVSLIPSRHSDIEDDTGCERVHQKFLRTICIYFWGGTFLILENSTPKFLFILIKELCFCLQ